MEHGLPITPPDLTTVLRMHGDRLKSEFHAVKIGIIQSYDSSKRTARVQVSFRRLMWDDTITDYPVLYDCPVVTLQGGGIGTQFPITAGDECLVLFADADIDLWYQNGGAQVPNSDRKHDISDAVALVGLNSLARPLTTALSSDEGGIADSAAKVAVKSGKVDISNATQNLKTALDTFCTALGSATTFGQVNSAATALKTSIDALFY